ncbi:Glyco hydro 1 domain containing protein [Asbolus verrucosus]|uniref:Glyco hydro 1 domain containing protein n=1 Tax=Asbolus verrucosus TaxID=1661398 RepID=A0A482W938_ASBVE|nr:Glyco hydro 1 domain containing protein [Asbolus verrucosus]
MELSLMSLYTTEIYLDHFKILMDCLILFLQTNLQIMMSLYSICRLTKSQEWRFPDDFKFGVATSAYQVEGAWNADGKGVSIWDTFTHNRSFLIKDGSNGDIACDSYHKWEEDVMMAKNLGVQLFGISLSWTRILPDGYGTRINQAGVDYYNKLIDKLLENQIEPVFTLYHWDLPEVFSPLGGWSNPALIDYFAIYARTAFALFGDRVKTWITFNDARLICQTYKGLVGDITSVYPLGVIEYLCGHNILKAHAEAYHIYDEEFRRTQKGKVGITLDFTWSEPANMSNPADVRAAEQYIQFEFGIYANPILNYDYPEVVKDRVAQRSKLEGFSQSRLPQFTLAEKLRIRGTYDYLGINHYITLYAQAIEEPLITKPNIHIDAGGSRYSDTNWGESEEPWVKLVPWGLRPSLLFIRDRYGNPEILIMVNGYADASEVLDDNNRIKYDREFLKGSLQSINEDDVNVKAYIAWSLMDSFEWENGYTLKSGIYHVNFTDPNRARTPKKSAEFYKNVIRTATIV